MTRGGGQGQETQGERVTYATGDIRSWLAMGNRGERVRERGGAENTGMRRRRGQGQGTSGRESGQVGDVAVG